MVHPAALADNETLNAKRLRDQLAQEHREREESARKLRWSLGELRDRGGSGVWPFVAGAAAGAAVVLGS